MEHIQIIPDLEEQGFKDGEYPTIDYKGPITIGGMDNGTASGKPVVLIGIEVGEDVMVVQTTLALFLTAADMLKARYGDPR